MERLKHFAILWGLLGVSMGFMFIEQIRCVEVSAGFFMMFVIWCAVEVPAKKERS